VIKVRLMVLEIKKKKYKKLDKNIKLEKNT